LGEEARGLGEVGDKGGSHGVAVTGGEVCLAKRRVWW
jgi:hypothetical protein